MLGTSSLGSCLSSTGVLPLSVSMVGSRVVSTYFFDERRIRVWYHFGTLRNNAILPFGVMR